MIVKSLKKMKRSQLLLKVTVCHSYRRQGSICYPGLGSPFQTDWEARPEISMRACVDQCRQALLFVEDQGRILYVCTDLLSAT